MLHIESKALCIVMSSVFAFGFLVFIAPFFTGIVNVGNCFGAFICLLLSLFFSFNDNISAVLSGVSGYKTVRIAVSAVTALIISGFILGAVISGFMIHAISNKPVSDDTVIVLGCKVKGTRPSLMLKKRLDAACGYLNENPEVSVIVSGGQGSDEKISEAECMKNYLVENGIDTERIYMENKSTNTYENFKFSQEIMQRYSLGSNLTVVTDGYHQLRAGMIADKLGIKTSSVSAPTSLWLIPTYWVREWFAVIYTFIK